MLILIEIDNGEQWEDYHAWINSVIDVETEKTLTELDLDYKNFIYNKLLNEYNIEVNLDYPNIIISKNKKILKKDEELVIKINNEFSFSNWLKSNYNCKELEFQTYHQYHEY